MKFAYADPPYLGHAASFYSKMHEHAADYDDPETHRALIVRLSDEYPDGWAMSLHSPGLRVLLPMCPDDSRVMAWVKPFASFKPGVGVGYTWEPVIVRGGRKRTRQQHTVRDYVACNIAMQRGFPGAKPDGFVYWILDVLNAEADDEIDDLFPGSGAVGRSIEKWRNAPRLALAEQHEALAFDV